MSNFFEISANFTKPNNSDLYSNGDVIGTNPATNIVFSNIGNANTHIKIRQALIKSSGVASYPNLFKLHLFTSAPTAILDNSPFDVISSDRDKYIGYINFISYSKTASYITYQSEVSDLQILLANTSIYGVLQINNDIPISTPLAYYSITLTGESI